VATSATESARSALHVVMSPGLHRQPHGLQRLVTVKVVVGLDDEAISQAVNDGEGLRVWRVLALPHHARAGDEAAIANVDQIVEAHLEWPSQIDQALHPCERSGTSSVDTGIGPARSLAVPSIFGPELIGHCHWTRLVPDLIGPTDAAGVLLRHRPPSIPRRRGGCEARTARSKDRRMAQREKNSPHREEA
jgi:hypothetical protein